jgi:hypothetical protein
MAKVSRQREAERAIFRLIRQAQREGQIGWHPGPTSGMELFKAHDRLLAAKKIRLVKQKTRPFLVGYVIVKPHVRKGRSVKQYQRRPRRRA